MKKQGWWWADGRGAVKLVPATYDGVELRGYSIDGEGGWWFWNETGADALGPYLTYADARIACVVYAESL